MMRVSTRIGLGLPSRSICVLLEHPQQLDLDVHRQIADLVEEDRRVIRQLEASHLPRQRPGKRAFLPPEQFALEERGRNRRAVHAHHRSCMPGAQLVNLRREELLAGAGFAEQQHGRISGCYELYLFEDLPDGAALADDVAGAVALPRFGAKVDILGVQLVAQPTDFFERSLECLVALPPCQHTAERAREDAQAMNHFRRPGTLPVHRREADSADNPTRDGEGHRHCGPYPIRAVVGPVDGIRYVIDAREAQQLTSLNSFVHPRGLAL